MRWHCFAAARGRSFLKAWHLVYRSKSGVHVLCGRDHLLHRSRLWEASFPVRLCQNCLLRLAWRWGREGWR
jgi:hypothetical protein